MSANDCVPVGGSPHASAGEIFFPTHEYFAGMDAPFANASLVRVSELDTIASVGSAGEEQAESIRMKSRKRLRFMPASISRLFDFSFTRRVPRRGD